MSQALIMTTTLLSVFLIIYHHILYPLILKLLAKTKTSPALSFNARKYQLSSADQVLPHITLLIPAYNEQRWIAEKIRNIAALDYPKDKLSVLIGCDGCTDHTVQISEQTIAENICHELSIKLYDFKENRGKVALINDLMGHINSDLVAMSDVSALLSVDALLIAAEHFKTPSIGIVNAHYRLLNPGSTGEQVYWSYQSTIKACEATFGASLGSHGALYFFRRSLFSPLEADTINDDFILPMRIVAQGYKAAYEPRIHALELEQSTAQLDQSRRYRFAAGNCQQLIRLRALLNPKRGVLAILFFSGKALRVITPFLMILSLIGSIALVQHSLYTILAGLQLAT